jgi:hypothetical protein
MKNDTSKRRRASLSGHVSSMQKGVRYLDGDDKAAMRSQLRKVFKKIKIPLLTH